MASTIRAVENAEKAKNAKKPKDLLSLHSINSILTKILNKRNAWVAQTEHGVCHMKYSQNVLRFLFCEPLSEDLEEFAQTANKQSKSDLYGHDLTLHYLNETIPSQIDDIVLQHQKNIISKQSLHMEEMVLLSIDLFYCCSNVGIYLFTDRYDKYIGDADTRIDMSVLQKKVLYEPGNHQADTKYLKSILCNSLYKAFVEPIISDMRYQWLYKLLERFNYIKAEQAQISEQFLFDFLAIISILALDLSNCSSSTEPYMRAVYSFFNIEGEFQQAYAAYVANTCFQSVTSDQDNTDTNDKAQNNLIGQQIKKNQTVQELQEQLKQIIDLIIRDLLRNSQYVTLSRDFQEMEKHLDYIRKYYQSLRDDFDNTSSPEYKQAYVDELYHFYDSQRTRELPSLVSKLTIEKTR